MKIFIYKLMLGVIAASSTAVVFADNSWGNYHWARTSNPFALTVVDSVTSSWDDHLDAANVEWSEYQSPVLTLAKVAGKTSSSERKRCWAVKGQIRVCNATYGNNGWLGMAQIWVSGGHITQGTTKVNDTYFNTSTYNTPSWRQMVICQEIGHDLGLDHQDVTFNNTNLGSCMDYTNNPVGNEYPNAHDFDQLAAIYTHLDGTTTVSSTQTTAPGQVSFDTRSQWGPLVWSSANGRSQTFELDLGNGNRLITHVLWADPDTDAR